MVDKNYAKNVFINCPFDKEYYQLLKTLIFTIVYFGFNPRLALEKSDSGKSRFEKILELIKISKYGIHDLSRIKAEKANDFFRFNMPFELGVDFGCRNFNKSHKDKEFLILGEKPYEYMQAISDLNGIDIKNHFNDPEELIEKLRSWFTETVNLRNLDSQLKIWYKFTDFNSWLFEEKFIKYYGEFDENTSEKMAKVEVEKMPIPEFIDEIKRYFKNK